MVRKWKFYPFIVLISVFVFALQGCNLPIIADNELSVDERAQTSVALTLADGEDDEEPEEDVGVTEEVQQGPGPTITDTLMPTITLTPTITATVTLETPMVSVSMDTNCRSGPGEIYDYIGALLIGEQAVVVGRSADGQYWIIENPDQPGECWLWGHYATVTGLTADLPEYTPPPTPTPTITLTPTVTSTPEFYWEGEWSATVAAPDAVIFVLYAMTVTVEGNNFTAVVDMTPVGGGIMNATGTISDDFMSVSGTWTTADDNGTFQLFALGDNQFQGNRSNGEVLGWCGGKGGAGLPSPCLMP